jgi:hypothetical protein
VPHPYRDRRRARKDVYDGFDYTSWEEFQAAVRRGAEAEEEWLMRSEDGDDEEY